jgi:hypothetical protein
MRTGLVVTIEKLENLGPRAAGERRVKGPVTALINSG